VQIKPVKVPNLEQVRNFPEIRAILVDKNGVLGVLVKHFNIALLNQNYAGGDHSVVHYAAAFRLEGFVSKRSTDHGD
jgi:hypothetical protein